MDIFGTSDTKNTKVGCKKCGVSKNQDLILSRLQNFVYVPKFDKFLA